MVEFADELRQIAFAFGQGEAAGGQGDAGHRTQTQAGDVLGDIELVLGQQCLDVRLLLLGHAADDQILVRGETEIAGVDLGDFAQAGLRRLFLGIAQAAVLDEKGVMPVAVGAFGPAVAVAGTGEFERARLAELPTETGFEFVFEPVHSAVLDGVFEARVLAVGAVAEIALHGENFFRHFDDFFAGKVTDHVGETRIGLGVAVRHAKAAADGEIVAEEFPVFPDGDETEVLRVDVDIVARRHGEAGFEFAREISFAVDGFFLLVVGDFFAVQPDLMVRAGARGEMGADCTRIIEHRAVQGGLPWVRIGHDIAVHVAAGRDAVHHRIVDALHGRFENFLRDEVQLEGLSRGQLERVAAILIGQRVDLEPLLRSADAPGHADADHENEGFFRSGSLALNALVPVVLLVDAVELGHRCVIVRDGPGRTVFQTGDQRAAEVIAGLFDALDLGEGRRIGVVGNHVFVIV